MTDLDDRDGADGPLPAAQQALFAQVATLQLDGGARERVRQATEARLEARTPGRAGLGWRWVPVLATAAILLLVLARRPGSPVTVPGAGAGGAVAAAQVQSADGTWRGQTPVTAGAPLGAGEVEVRAGGTLAVSVAGASVKAQGPARLEVASSPLALRLSSGQVTVDGQLLVEAPVASGGSCRARVRGQSHVSIDGLKVQVRVVAGSAEMLTPGAACVLVELTPPAPAASAPGAAAAPPLEAAPPAVAVEEPVAPGDVPIAPPARAPRARTSRVVPPAPTVPAPPASPPVAAAPSTPEPESSVVKVEEPAGRPVAERAVAPERATGSARTVESRTEPARSALSRVVEDYREARQLNRADDRAALERWRTLRSRWRTSELIQEIELNLIETLVRLGRVDEARAEAGAFARRYPRSLRAAEMRALGAGGSVAPAPGSR